MVDDFGSDAGEEQPATDELSRLIRDAADAPGSSYQRLADRAFDPVSGFQMSRAHLHKLATGAAHTPPGAARLRAISAACRLPLTVVQRAAAAQFLGFRPDRSTADDADTQAIVALLAGMRPLERRRWRAMMEAALDIDETTDAPMDPSESEVDDADEGNLGDGKYERYGRPVPPSDPDAEYMTIQETAHVLKISVTYARRLVRQTGLYSRMGRRIVTSKKDRAGLYEICHAGGASPRRRLR